MPEYTPDQFARILLTAAARTPQEASRVVGRGGQNVKDGAQRNVLRTAPVHNAGAHKTITYDDPTVDGDVVSTDIGYDRSRGRAAALGNLLEYGGGGDHSPPHHDLRLALEAEEPRFVDAVADMAERIID